MAGTGILCSHMVHALAGEHTQAGEVHILAGLVDILAVVVHILAGLVDILAGLVDILAGLVDILAGLVDILAGLVDILVGLVDLLAGLVDILEGISRYLYTHLDNNYNHLATYSLRQTHTMTAPGMGGGRKHPFPIPTHIIRDCNCHLHVCFKFARQLSRMVTIFDYNIDPRSNAERLKYNPTKKISVVAVALRPGPNYDL